tara:strand:+ start:158 stop:526 length:369 start_codon:yes stop_codon:yes gene_type:complete
MIILSSLLAVLTTAAYALDIPWLQVIFLLYLTSIVHFAVIILQGAYKYHSLTLFATVVAQKQTTMDIPSKVIIIRFITFDVLFSCMLLYLQQPGLAVLYLSAHALIHYYYSLVGTLERKNPH